MLNSARQLAHSLFEEEKMDKSIATTFVDLDNKNNGILGTPEETNILLTILKAAGFTPKKLENRKLCGYYTDQDGSKTGETYEINKTCPITVIDQDDEPNCYATGWLNDIIRLALRFNMTTEQKIASVQTEVTRCVPLKPIQLTPDGDFLNEYPPEVGSKMTDEWFVDHVRDKDKLPEGVSPTGIHEHCGGVMYLHGATKTHNSISCDECHLRILFPKKINTYGKLREFFKF